MHEVFPQRVKCMLRNANMLKPHSSGFLVKKLHVVIFDYFDTSWVPWLDFNHKFHENWREFPL